MFRILYYVTVRVYRPYFMSYVYDTIMMVS